MKKISDHIFMLFAGSIFSFLVLLLFFLIDASGNGNAVNDAQNSVFMIALRIIVVAPIVEELVFRLLFYEKVLKRRLGVSHMTASLISSALFGMFHAPAMVTFVSVILGVILCCIYNSGTRVSYCIAFHAGFNLFSFTAAFFPF